MEILGIDIGGSGIKAAVVNTSTGALVTERERIATPSPATPEATLPLVRDLLEAHAWRGPVGCGFPGVIHGTTIHTAANLDDSFIGVDWGEALSEITGGPSAVLNDADAAGMAEMRFGAGRGHNGLVMILTIGTGIGTALFHRGELVPNAEIGHIEYEGAEAESFLSEAARKQQGLSWKQWGKRFNGFLQYLEGLLWPDLFILGGGGAKKSEKFDDFLSPRTPWVLAEFGNRAGIIGAAMAAAETLPKKRRAPSKSAP